MILSTYRDRTGAWRARAESDDIRVWSAPFDNVVGERTRDGEIAAIRQVVVAVRVLAKREERGDFVVTQYGQIVVRARGQNPHEVR